jgi:hypothetical protein
MNIATNSKKSMGEFASPRQTAFGNRGMIEGQIVKDHATMTRDDVAKK